MSKPTAVIDKSVLQLICQEPEPNRSQFWNELLGRYQLVIPFVLVEEVWVNYAKPGQKDMQVVQKMVNTLARMASCWIDDDVEYVFRELVQRKPLKRFLALPKKYIDGVVRVSPTDPALNRWFEQKRLLKEKAILARLQDQRSILAPGTFAKIKTPGDLFEKLVREQFAGILQFPSRTYVLLEKLFGEHFRQRHPNFKRRIEKAFHEYSKETFLKYPFTLNFIMASMFYFYAPICRIEGRPKVAQVKILGSKRVEQLHNLEDQQYVVPALFCDRLLTADEGMRNIMGVFRESQLWKGQTIYIDPRNPVVGQIPVFLI